MSTTSKTKQKWSIKAVLLFILTTVAFLASFVALFIMAVLAGWAPWIAWGLPVMIDGAIVMTIIDMVEARRRGRKPGFALLVFIACSLLSMFLNGYHAYITPGDLGLPAWIRVVIGVTPPLLLLMLTKLFESAIEREAPLEVLTEVIAPDKPETALSAVAEVPAIAELPAPSQPDAAITDLTDVPRHDPPVATAERDHDESPAPPQVGPEALAGHEEPEAAVTGGWAPPSQSVTDDAVTAPESMTDEDDAVVTELVAEAQSLPKLHAVETIPADPAGQINWIVARARAGQEMTKKAVLQVFEEAGQPISDSTAQRRLREARQMAPEAFAA